MGGGKWGQSIDEKDSCQLKAQTRSVKKPAETSIPVIPIKLQGTRDMSLENNILLCGLLSYRCSSFPVSSHLPYICFLALLSAELKFPPFLSPSFVLSLIVSLLYYFRTKLSWTSIWVVLFDVKDHLPFISFKGKFSFKYGLSSASYISFEFPSFADWCFFFSDFLFYCCTVKLLLLC